MRQVVTFQTAVGGGDIGGGRWWCLPRLMPIRSWCRSLSLYVSVARRMTTGTVDCCCEHEY